MIHGRKVSGNGGSYLKKPHFCPKCKTQLEPITMRKVINSKSHEPKPMEFSQDRTHLAGNIEYVWKELKCPSCERQFSIEEMKKIEYDSLPYEEQQKIDRRNTFFAWLLGLGIAAAVILSIIEGLFAN